MSNSTNQKSELFTNLPRVEDYNEYYILRDFDLRPEKVKDYPTRLNPDLIEELLELGLLFRTREEALSAWNAMIETNTNLGLTPKEWRRALKCIPTNIWKTFLSLTPKKKKVCLNKWWDWHTHKIIAYWTIALGILTIIINITHIAIKCL